MQDRFLVSVVVWGSASGAMFGLLLDESVVGVVVCLSIGAVASCAWAWNRDPGQPQPVRAE